MASVQDVFAQMQAEQAEVLEDETFTPDPNEYCMLESDATRRILIPQKYAVFGVESDEKTNRIKFAFPKAVNDIQDLTQYNLRFNYIDAKGNTDQITARNMQVQGDYVLFDWILTRNVTRYQGNISFIVCAVTVKEDGVISNEWNTTIATAQSLEGIETEPTPGEEQIARDLLTELLVSLNNSKNNAITEITQTKTKAISDIETEGQTQTEAVDAKGAQVLESIPDDYTTLEKRVDELEQNRAYVIVGNGSGEFVTLNDSSELKTRNVKLFGKSVQAETTGVQLFDVMAGKNEDASQYKITINDYATGKFTVSIDNPSGALVMPNNTLSDWCPTMTAGKTYYLSGNADSTANKDINLKNISENWSFGTTRQITEEDLQSVAQFGFGTYSNIMIVEGTTEKPYEVYTGGEPATEPTPDYPLPITSAGNYDAESEKYEIGIGVRGTQLLSLKNIDNYVTNGVTVNTLEGGGYKVVGRSTRMDGDYVRIADSLYLQKGTYTLSQKYVGSGDCYFYDDSGYFLPNNVESKTKTFEKQIIVEPYIRVKPDSDIDCVIYPMLNVGDSAKLFEKYKSQNTTLQIPNPLRGIPVDSGGNYTDADGQQWICDYIDRERGKYVQCVQEIVFDGSEDEAWAFSTSNNNRASIKISDKIKEKDHTKRLGVCDKLKYNVQVYYDTDYNTQGFVLTITNVFVRLGSEYNEIDSLQKFKDYLKLNNLTLIYVVENPIETDLSPDQLAALNLSTYQGITNIGTDTMPQVGVDVEYIADTKTYIDNAIAEAIAAIPTEQGGNKL